MSHSAGGESGRERKVATHAPAEEVSILRVLDEARSHHDGLEALPVDGPQLDVSEGCRQEEARQTQDETQHGEITVAVQKDTERFFTQFHKCPF